MKRFEPQDFDRLLALIPQGQQNDALYQAIEQMAQEAQVLTYPWALNIVLNLATVPAAPAPGVTVNGQLNIDATAPFMILSGSMQADIAGAAQTLGSQVLPNAAILLTDQSGNVNFMDQATPLSALFGSWHQPYDWREPKLMPANSQIGWSITSYEAANINNLRLTFHGYRIKKLPR
jgi:hypothetical protein